MKSADRAVRLMQRRGVDESLIGDLIERQRTGRSVLWLWRQAVVAIAHRIVATVRRDPAWAIIQLCGHVWIAVAVVALDLSLTYAWTHFLWHYAVAIDMAWYPRSIRWLARFSPQVIWQIVIFVHPWSWTYMASWCAVLSSAAWGLVRLTPNRNRVTLTVFVLSNVCLHLPSLERSFLDWLHAPASPIWISGLVTYAMFVFLAIPLSIVAGGRGVSTG